MKNRKILIIGVGAVLLTTIILGIIYGGGKKETNSDNPEFYKYVTAYTSGVISKKSTIKVTLSDELSQQIDQEKIDNNSLITLSPGVNGKITWVDKQTIEFIPEKDLESNTEYTAELKLDELKKDIPDELSTFCFNFRTIKQNFEVRIQEQKTIDKKTLRWQKAIGLIMTADDESVENVKNLVSATQEGKELKINWLEAEDERSFHFEIDSIKRGEKASEVVLMWDGKPINSETKGEMKIEIPSIDDFKYMSYTIVHQPEQYIQLQFSDPLLENQYLEGLIYFNPEATTNFIIEDNVIRVYPSERLDGDYRMTIDKSVKNILGYQLKEDISIDLFFEAIKPAVRFVGEGNILPSSEKGLIVPFEAVNINAVDVRIVRIYENNVTQFLQVNELDGDNQLRRVGKSVVETTVPLNQTNVVDFGQWNRYFLDLNELIKTEPGAIYRITINFRKQHSVYPCIDEESTDEEERDISASFSELTDYEEYSYWDYYDDYYYYDDYSFEDRDNPCNGSYYGNRRSVSKNIIASNMGLIAKKGNNGSMNIIVTDLLTTNPMANVEVGVYDYAQQLIMSVKTDNQGIAVFPSLEEPYFVIAKNGKERGYLKLQDGSSLSLSMFDVSGVSVQKGVKGFIYGERGVWRPGDSVYVSFILEDFEKNLPEKYPVVFELRNPDNQLVNRLVQQKNAIGFYSFKFKTDQDAPTGYYQVRIEAGGVEFSQSLRIETIKPNRLKIDFNFNKKFLTKANPASATMHVKWLHGAIAKSLDARVEVILKPSSIFFEKLKDYNFDDPSKSYYSESDVIFDGTLDEFGNAEITADISTTESAPGKLEATFFTKVFEKGGDFSIDQFTIPYYAYESFVGIKLPKGDKTRQMLLTDTTHNVNIVTVDANGNLLKENHDIELTIYKVDWRWWWDQSYDNLSSYSGTSYIQPIQRDNIKTKGGKATWSFRVNYPDWGRYLVRAYDKTSGHTSAKTIYIDWPGWAGRSQKDQPGGASVLSLSTDKEKYTVGEKVNLTIPSGSKGRALVSIENGSKIVESHWVETGTGETQFSFVTSKEMTPNVYVNVTLIQPHAQVLNDLPIRLYGIVAISVEDPASHLDPVLTMPDVLKSEENVTIKVSEKNNKEMTYTIAIVDEGLLDITRYKTPDPWNHFYAKEALGVQTWDIYDHVIGAFGGELERILAIGGGDEGDGENGKKANRFKPMVRFLGPFHIKGGSKSHVIEIPKYIGSVRTMIIAGHEKAYGSAEKTTPVIKPLMLLGTLPRVLGPGETLKLPVSVFAMENHIKNVSVQIKPNKLLKVNGETTKLVKFAQTGEEFIEFDIEVLQFIGIGKVEILATCGNEKASYEIELDVRNPNPRVTDVISGMVEAGKSWNQEITPIGISGTNKAVLEISSIPPLNLEKRLKYLIQYPHGCIEQTTSSAFPQLFLDVLTDLNETQKKDISRNIKNAIQRIQSMQMYNGGLSYWPGASNTCEWGTNYAGHFMIEATNKGYTVSPAFLKNWKKYQKTKSNSWTDDGPASQLTQAYRLYTLALSGSPELGAMNRLKENKKLSVQAKWRLAAAYQIAGKEKTALGMIEGLSTDIGVYTELSYTFGSSTRDKAMILETLAALNKRETAFRLLKEISNDIAGTGWYSTQTTAYSLVAISKYVDKNVTSGVIDFSYSVGNGAPQKVTSKKSITQTDIPVKGTGPFTVKFTNNGKGMLYARVISSGIPLIGEETDANNDLSMVVKYMYLDGTSLDPTNIEQGTDFMAEVTISHPGINPDYKEMALSQIFPSGWEIINTRMLASGNYLAITVPKYQDFRDDRVYTYFDIYRNKTNTYRVLLNASYVGRFYLPAVSCEAMYDATINARKKGQWVEVIRPGL